MRGYERRFTKDKGVPWPRLPTILGCRGSDYQRYGGAESRVTNDALVWIRGRPTMKGCDNLDYQ